MGQTRVISARERSQHRRICADERSRTCFVTRQDGVDEAHARRAVAHEQIVDIAMSELQGHVMRGQAEAERPTVDMKRRHRCIAWLVYPGGDCLRIAIEHPRRQRNVAKAGRHEDVGVGAAFEEPPTDLRPLCERILGRAWTCGRRRAFTPAP